MTTYANNIIIHVLIMHQHGYNAKDLILSSIISIPKDMKTSLSSSTNYRGISLFNAIGKVFELCNIIDF